MLPWLDVTVGSGLMLHAPLALPVDIGPIQAEFATLDATLGAEERGCWGGDGSWTVITLVDPPTGANAGQLKPGTPNPILERMPSVRALLESVDGVVTGCHISRQAPDGVLPWHYEDQALHLDACRLLVPIHAPPGAVTWIGTDAVAYPEGTAWTGDFSFPHQVENRTDAQRIVLLIDVVTGAGVRRLAPAAMAEHAQFRAELSAVARNHLLNRPKPDDQP